MAEPIYPSLLYGFSQLKDIFITQSDIFVMAILIILPIAKHSVSARKPIVGVIIRLFNRFGLVFFSGPAAARRKKNELCEASHNV